MRTRFILGLLAMGLAALLAGGAYAADECAADGHACQSGPAAQGGGCDCDCEPTFFVRAEALWLKRDEPRNAPIATRGLLGPTVLSTSDMGDYDFAAGPRLTLGCQLDACRTLELSYFGFNFWRGSASVESGGLLDRLYPTGPLDDVSRPVLSSFNRVDEYDIQYRSQLHSAEFNVRRQPSPAFSWLYGIRYTSVEERFDIEAVDRAIIGPDRVGSAVFRTHNNLIGMQLGVDWARPLSDRWSIGASGKAGIYDNLVYVDNTVCDPKRVLQPRLDYKDNTSRAAGIFELGANATYSVSPHFQIRGGYNLMWLTGLALAAEQGATTTVADGSMFLHGPSVGIEWRR